MYQLGADLQVFDIAAGTGKPIPIVRIPTSTIRAREVDQGANGISDERPPVARRDEGCCQGAGRVFVMPRKGGRLVEAGRKPGVRYRDARFLPDGKTLLMLSDESGEVELWTVAADGLGQATRLATDGAVMRRGARRRPTANMWHTPTKISASSC